MDLPDPDSVPRREFCKAAVALGGVAGLSACLGRDGDSDEDAVEGGPLDGVPAGDPGDAPERQHAWNDALDRDEAGNAVPPTHHVLRYVDVDRGDETLAAARERVEAAFTDLERAFERSPAGLLFTVGYSPSYFDRLSGSLPESVDLPAPRPLTGLEDPSFDEADALVHLAADDPAAVLAADEALFGGATAANGVAVTDAGDLFEPVDRRTGFHGPGLPRERRDVDGIPDDAPVPEGAPLFMGFANGFAASQATEGRVTIGAGPFAGGTTQQVSTIRTQLDAWWSQESHAQRVAKLFSPTHADEERVGEYGERLGDDPGVADLPEDAVAYAREEGVVGHAQKAARAREDGEPRLLRRDFPTTDGDHTGIHFLTLQESIADFVAVRDAMTGADITDETAVGSRVNNGILQYLFVRSRGNFLVPPRGLRALPDPNPRHDR
ncbi:Dyp-type peroxidase [Halorubrum sp. 2020YC2]|uniref:Dyp-type peroxidase n=1 Tax=Halorubrum sp. 2020YC2 TaxID=2836432 RepID=UPI001BE5126D|nr:Dyp-type peroxidase [Halorubrum sp. 2020YC2]QWC20535.1 Dyp-type peroxidase [Halorubrum sp. 2020YC2]